jgi:hypothetical protein
LAPGGRPGGAGERCVPPSQHLAPTGGFRRECYSFVPKAKEVGSEASEHTTDDLLRQGLEDWADGDEPHFWLPDFEEFRAEEATVEGRDVRCAFAGTPIQAVGALRELTEIIKSECGLAQSKRTARSLFATGGRAGRAGGSGIPGLSRCYEQTL